MRSGWAWSVLRSLGFKTEPTKGPGLGPCAGEPKSHQRLVCGLPAALSAVWAAGLKGLLLIETYQNQDLLVSRGTFPHPQEVDQ